MPRIAAILIIGITVGFILISGVVAGMFLNANRKTMRKRRAQLITYEEKRRVHKLKSKFRKSSEVSRIPFDGNINVMRFCYEDLVRASASGSFVCAYICKWVQEGSIQFNGRNCVFVKKEPESGYTDGERALYRFLLTISNEGILDHGVLKQWHKNNQNLLRKGDWNREKDFKLWEIQAKLWYRNLKRTVKSLAFHSLQMEAVAYLKQN